MISERKLKELTFLLTKMSKNQGALVYDFAVDVFENRPPVDAWLDARKPKEPPPKNLTLVEEMQQENGVPTEAILALYNECCTKLAKVKEFTGSRRRAVIARWKASNDRQTLAWWKHFFTFVNERCSFLTGANDRSWRANFDFLLREENMVRITENQYVDRRRPTQR